jgi:hypothetical protein
MSHHNASAQVFCEADGTRFVWIADLLPHELAPRIAGMIEAGLEAIKRTLEAGTDAVDQGRSLTPPGNVDSREEASLALHGVHGGRAEGEATNLR